MKKPPYKINRKIFIISILSIVTLIAAIRADAQEDQAFMAGAAAIDMDLPAGIPIAGFGAGSRRRLNPTKKHSRFSYLFKEAKPALDPIRSKTIVLQQGSKKLIWIAVDMIAASPKFIEVIAKKVEPLGFTREQILLSASHTHSSPGAFVDNKFWSFMAVDVFNQEIFDHITNKIYQSVHDAVKALKPAVVGTSEVRIDNVTNNRRQAPYLDPVATILRIDGVDGTSIATLFNFPIHPTVQGPSNLHLSSDVSGAIEQEVERSTNAVAIFLNGALGDVSPSSSEGVDPWHRAQSLGQKIAQSIVQSRALIVPHAIQNFLHVSSELKLPRSKVNLIGCINKKKAGKIFFSLGKYMPRSVTLHGVLIDDVAFLTVPGEPITELGLNIKNFGQKLGFAKVGVVSLTDDHLGYILTPEEYDKGGGESCSSLYGRQLGNLFIDTSFQVLQNLAK